MSICIKYQNFKVAKNNEGMHWKENQDNISPIAAKLENLTIKKLIQDVFN